jgi:pentatricopeptide repeat protein
MKMDQPSAAASLTPITEIDKSTDGETNNVHDSGTGSNLHCTSTVTTNTVTSEHTSPLLAAYLNRVQDVANDGTLLPLSLSLSDTDDAEQIPAPPAPTGTVELQCQHNDHSDGDCQSVSENICSNCNCKSDQTSAQQSHSELSPVSVITGQQHHRQPSPSHCSSNKNKSSSPHLLSPPSPSRARRHRRSNSGASAASTSTNCTSLSPDTRRLVDYFVVVGTQDALMPLPAAQRPITELMVASPKRLQRQQLQQQQQRQRLQQQFPKPSTNLSSASNSPQIDVDVSGAGSSDTLPVGLHQFSKIEFTVSGAPADLNGWSYFASSVYLYIQRAASADVLTTNPHHSTSPITDIVIICPDKGEKCPPGYTRIDHDLNQGSYGNTLHLCYSRNGKLPILDIVVIAEKHKEECPAQYVVLPRNLNEGSFRDPIHLAIRRGSTSADQVRLTTAVVDRFPAHDLVHAPLPPAISMFCQPQGALLARGRPPLPKHHTFVLTMPSGDEMFASCVCFYEPFEFSDKLLRLLQCAGAPMPIQHDDPGSSSSGSPSWSATETKCQYFAPKSILIVSREPFFDCFSTYLTELYRASVGRGPIPLERYLSNLWEAPLPRTSRVNVQLCIGHQRIVFDRPPADQFPLTNFSFQIMFKLLSVNTVLKLFAAVLLERKIVMCSSRLSVLTPVAQTLLALIFPLRWSYAYIPVLPDALTGMIEAPMPVLVGIHTDNINHYISGTEDIIIVDLDNDRITPVNGPALTPLPSRIASVLKKELEDHAGVQSIRRVSQDVDTLDTVGLAFLHGPLLDADGDLHTDGDGTVHSLFAAVQQRKIGQTYARNASVTNTTMSSPQSDSGASRSSSKSLSLSALLPSSVTFSRTATRDPVAIPSSAAGSETRFSTVACRACFTHCIISLLGKYQDFIVPDGLLSGDGPLGSSYHRVFARHDYVAAARRDSRSFLKCLVESQSFACFIESHLHTNRPETMERLKFFDQCVDYEMKLQSARTRVGAHTFTGIPPLVCHLSGRKYRSELYVVPEPPREGLPEHAMYTYDSFPRLNPAMFARPRPLEKQYLADVAADRREVLLCDLGVFSLQTGAMSTGGTAHRADEAKANRAFGDSDTGISHSNIATMLKADTAANPSSPAPSPTTSHARKLSVSDDQTHKSLSPQEWSKAMVLCVFETWFQLQTAAIEAHSQPDKVVLDIFRVLTRLFEELDLTPSEHIFRSILIVCGRYRKRDEARAVFDVMQQCGVKPGSSTYGAYANALAAGLQLITPGSRSTSRSHSRVNSAQNADSKGAHYQRTVSPPVAHTSSFSRLSQSVANLSRSVSGDKFAAPHIQLPCSHSTPMLAVQVADTCATAVHTTAVHTNAVQLQSLAADDHKLDYEHEHENSDDNDEMYDTSSVDGDEDHEDDWYAMLELEELDWASVEFELPHACPECQWPLTLAELMAGWRSEHTNRVICIGCHNHEFVAELQVRFRAYPGGNAHLHRHKSDINSDVKHSRTHTHGSTSSSHSNGSDNRNCDREQQLTVTATHESDTRPSRCRIESQAELAAALAVQQAASRLQAHHPMISESPQTLSCVSNNALLAPTNPTEPLNVCVPHEVFVPLIHPKALSRSMELASNEFAIELSDKLVFRVRHEALFWNTLFHCWLQHFPLDALLPSRNIRQLSGRRSYCETEFSRYDATHAEDKRAMHSIRNLVSEQKLSMAMKEFLVRRAKLDVFSRTRTTTSLRPPDHDSPFAQSMFYCLRRQCSVKQWPNLSFFARKFGVALSTLSHSLQSLTVPTDVIPAKRVLYFMQLFHLDPMMS